MKLRELYLDNLDLVRLRGETHGRDVLIWSWAIDQYDPQFLIEGDSGEEWIEFSQVEAFQPLWETEDYGAFDWLKSENTILIPV